MEKELHYDREFLKFSENMQHLVDTVDGSVEKVRKAVEAIADTFELGKMELTLEAPESPLVPGGELGVKHIYEWDGMLEEIPFFLEMETGERGIACANFYPRRGVNWNENTRAFLKLVGYYAIADIGSSRKGELLRKSIVTDLQTGIANLNGYMTTGQALLGKGKLGTYTSLYFNIRNFKYVNSAIGYMGGTQVLTAYSQRIQAFTNSSEVVSRLGGDNFVALIQNERLEDFLKLIQSTEIEVEHGGKKRSFVFGAICGAYQIPANINMMGEVMMGASMAFQQAKNNQQSIVYFSQEMFQSAMREKEVLVKFPQALAQGEYIVYYQPKINLKNNSIMGAEVLARWNENGEIHNPAYFIPALESDGTICKLDFYMLDCACKKIRKWLDKGQKPIELSVNFSRWHLRNSSFVDEIFEALHRNQVPGKYIEIEVTETVKNEDFKTLLAAIKKMKEQDITVSIDDFGTGYSSLTMLRQIPADILKMDKSFLNDDIQERDKKMLDHIVGMAKDLSMQVLAEGVENSTQRDYLSSIGCDAVQGFLYDQPLPEAEFDKRLAQDFKYQV